MLEVKTETLSRAYGDKIAVDSVSFEVKAGEILAFLGPNGAGKTTTINMLTGLIKPSSGKIYYGGKEFTPDSYKLKKVIGVVPQHNNVDRDLTVTENLRVHALLYGMKDQLEEKIKSAVMFAGLAEHADKHAGKLSGGMKRRLVIARALLHEPSVLFLDEPTTGLDVEARRAIWEFVKKINREKGCTVFLTTHYIEEAEQLASRVIIIDRAVIVAEGLTSDLKDQTGRWAMDIDYADKGLVTEFFQTREEAVKRLENTDLDARIREVNLEDVYLHITGRRMKD